MEVFPFFPFCDNLYLRFSSCVSIFGIYLVCCVAYFRFVFMLLPSVYGAGCAGKINNKNKIEKYNFKQLKANCCFIFPMNFIFMHFNNANVRDALKTEWQFLYLFIHHTQIE